jgi:hypothetical protein
VGTNFLIYDAGLNPLQSPDPALLRRLIQMRLTVRELATVTYEQNILGYNGPRKMTIHLPAMKQLLDGKFHGIPIKPMREEEGIIALAAHGHPDVVALANKVWLVALIE